MAANHRVTIIDVARHAQVSPGTVSNALTGKRPVNEETRRRIVASIEELGYQPNLVARSLVNQSSCTLAVVTSGLEYYGPSRSLVGMEQQAHELGYSLLLNLLHRPDLDDVAPVLNELSARRVDGIIWAVHEIGDNRAWIEQQSLRELPPIVFLTMQRMPGVSIITTDNRAGARLATEHLLDLGRRSIGLITGPLNWWEARERQAGWQEALNEAALNEAALNEAALNPHADWVVEGDWFAASGQAGMQKLLQRNPHLDAIFACNDEMALGALRAAHLLGKRVPEEIAIVGYDNMPEAGFLWPSLTSIRQHLVQLGRLAVLELQQLIDARRSEHGRAEHNVHVVAPELVIRDSTVAGASAS